MFVSFFSDMRRANNIGILSQGEENTPMHSVAQCFSIEDLILMLY